MLSDCVWLSCIDCVLFFMFSAWIDGVCFCMALGIDVSCFCIVVALMLPALCMVFVYGACMVCV